MPGLPAELLTRWGMASTRRLGAERPRRSESICFPSFDNVEWNHMKRPGPRARPLRPQSNRALWVCELLLGLDHRCGDELTRHVVLDHDRVWHVDREGLRVEVVHVL